MDSNLQSAVHTTDVAPVIDVVLVPGRFIAASTLMTLLHPRWARRASAPPRSLVSVLATQDSRSLTRKGRRKKTVRFKPAFALVEVFGWKEEDAGADEPWPTGKSFDPGLVLEAVQLAEEGDEDEGEQKVDWRQKELALDGIFHGPRHRSCWGVTLGPAPPAPVAQAAPVTQLAPATQPVPVHVSPPAPVAQPVPIAQPLPVHVSPPVYFSSPAPINISYPASESFSDAAAIFADPIAATAPTSPSPHLYPALDGAWNYQDQSLVVRAAPIPGYPFRVTYSGPRDAVLTMETEMKAYAALKASRHPPPSRLRYRSLRSIIERLKHLSLKSVLITKALLRGEGVQWRSTIEEPPQSTPQPHVFSRLELLPNELLLNIIQNLRGQPYSKLCLALTCRRFGRIVPFDSLEELDGAGIVFCGTKVEWPNRRKKGLIGFRRWLIEMDECRWVPFSLDPFRDFARLGRDVTDSVMWRVREASHRSLDRGRRVERAARRGVGHVRHGYVVGFERAKNHVFNRSH